MSKNLCRRQIAQGPCIAYFLRSSLPSVLFRRTLFFLLAWLLAEAGGTSQAFAQSSTCGTDCLEFNVDDSMPEHYLEGGADSLVHQMVFNFPLKTSMSAYSFAFRLAGPLPLGTRLEFETQGLFPDETMHFADDGRSIVVAGEFPDGSSIFVDDLEIQIDFHIPAQDSVVDPTVDLLRLGIVEVDVIQGLKRNEKERQSLYDWKGKAFYEDKLVPVGCQPDLQGLPGGWYLLKRERDHGPPTYQKLLVTPQ